MSTLRILLAEDNLVNQKVVVKMLDKLGYSTDLASDGESAVALARTAAYDVIFMDLMMPRMDGYEAASIIRSAETGAHRSHIIALTANAMGSDRIRSLEAGMDDFMTKPFMLETLKEKLSSFDTAFDNPEQASDEIDQIVDRTVLRSLASMMDDDDTAYIRELLSDYLVDAERLRADIYRAVANGDAAELRRAAHTLKSTCATFGARHLSKLCAELEQNAIRSEISEASDRLSEFDTILEAFHAELTRVVETDTY